MNPAVHWLTLGIALSVLDIIINSNEHHNVVYGEERSANGDENVAQRMDKRR